MSPVAAPSDRRFRRAHVKPSRRRRWRALLTPVLKYGVLGIAVVFALYQGGVIVAHAKALQITTISVHGNVQLPPTVVAEALRGLEGENILLIDLAMWRARLVGSPWIKDAALKRVLPSTIEVAVREREPVALGRIDGNLFLVDDIGVIDAWGPQYEKYDLPIVDGLAVRTGGEPAVDPARAALAARVIVALSANPEIFEQVSQIDVSDSRNAALLLNGDPTVIYLGTERFLPRLQSYLELADAMKARTDAADIDYVDLRFDDRIYIRPLGKGDRRRDQTRQPAAAGTAVPKKQGTAPAGVRKETR